MRQYLLHRLWQLAPVLFVATLVVFSILHLVPGDPVLQQFGLNDVTPEQLAAARKSLGLDRPLPIQYFVWVTDAATGDLGESYFSKVPVESLILDRFPATLQLTLVAVTIALSVGIPAGVLAAVRPNSIWSKLCSVFSSMTLAFPTFFVAMLFVLIFGVHLAVVPATSTYIPLWEDPIGALRSLIGPALTLGIFVAGVLARFVRVSLIEVLSSDYIRAARARGVSNSAVLWRHGLRNASLPTVTVIGIEVGTFLGGAVVVEAVFNYPGMGRLILSAVLERDFPVVQGTVLFAVVIFTLVTLLVDVLYALLNPRIRLG